MNKNFRHVLPCHYSIVTIERERRQFIGKGTKKPNSVKRSATPEPQRKGITLLPLPAKR